MVDAGRPTGRARRWTRGELVVCVAGALLVLDLFLLPWHHFALNLDLEKFGVKVPAFSYDRNGVQNPHAFFGVAALVVTVGMMLQIVAAKVSAAVPRLEQIHLIAGPVVLGLLTAKLLANNDYLGRGAWIGMLLAAAVAYGGFALSQETAGAPTVAETR
jgi:hypothetical protein